MILSNFSPSPLEETGKLVKFDRFEWLYLFEIR